MTLLYKAIDGYYSKYILSVPAYFSPSIEYEFALLQLDFMLI